MATNLEIKGDLTQISDRQLKYIQSVIVNLGYTNNKVTIQPLGQAGDNYVANIKRITVDDGKGGTFKMVVKVAPAHKQMRLMANTEALFRNEHIMYTKVLPKFTQLEISAGVPPEERLRYAACYGSLDEAPNEVIILEDLNESNFKMLDRFKSLNNDCVKSVLKNFALLHSLSYALKYQEPMTFEEYKSSLFDTWAAMEGNDLTLMYFQIIENNAFNILDKDTHKRAVKGVVTGFLKDLKKLANYEKSNKHSIIQQGDAWTNNIMFKFEGENLLESTMIDYQVSKPTSPAVDILYMISSCTDYELRKQHYYDWIDFYHSELDKFLLNYGLKSNLVYSRDQLDADLRRYSKNILGLSIFQAGFWSLKVEEAAEIKNAMESGDYQEILSQEKGISTDPNSVAILKAKIEGLIDNYREFGLL